jgi:hypothetical protein
MDTPSADRARRVHPDDVPPSHFDLYHGGKWHESLERADRLRKAAAILERAHKLPQPAHRKVDARYVATRKEIADGNELRMRGICATFVAAEAGDRA